MTQHAPFLTTRWSLVLSSKGKTVEAKRALGELCTAYWYPLFVQAKRGGPSDEDASDVVQGFITSLLEGGGLEGAEPSGGRFRSYLRGALRHYVLNLHRASRAARQDGGPVQSLNNDAFPAGLADAARRYDGSRSADLSPEEAFDRAWAQELIHAAKERLRSEYEGRGKALVFEMLEDTLDGSPGKQTHADRAATIGCTVGAVKVASHRLRARLGELIRAEVSHTIEQPGDLNEELAVLIQALRRKVE
ncbi:sigma-70 family RNA polymerase sigma factor [Planctomycetes bacterium Poly30]